MASFVIAGTTIRITWGRMMRRIINPGLMPSASADSVWPTGMAEKPERNTSAT